MAGRPKSRARREAREKAKKKLKTKGEKMVDRCVQLASGVPVGEKLAAREFTREENTFIRKRGGMVGLEFYDRVTEKLECLVDVLADDLKERHKDMPPQNLAYALAIALDKVNVLKGRPQALTANVSVGFGPKERTREEILDILGGRAELSASEEEEA